MKELPIAIFTRNRTGCAVATVRSLMDNLLHPGYCVRYIVCDDRSEPGHLDAILREFRARGIEPSVHVGDDRRNNLGAMMNMGLRDAFSTSDKCFRLEDDWLLKRPFDISGFADMLDDPNVCCVRLGIAYRRDEEFSPYRGFLAFAPGIPAKKRFFHFNNQLAIVCRGIHEKLGWYPENTAPERVETSMASRFNALTDSCRRPPYVLWPKNFARNTHYSESLPFAHIGVSITGHGEMYPIPKEYMGYNDPKLVTALRRRVLEPDALDAGRP